MLTVSCGTCTLPTGSTLTAFTSERGNVLIDSRSCLLSDFQQQYGSLSLSLVNLSHVFCHGKVKFSQQKFLKNSTSLRKHGLSLGLKFANSCTAGFSHSLTRGWTLHKKRYYAHKFAARPNISLMCRPLMQKKTKNSLTFI